MLRRAYAALGSPPALPDAAALSKHLSDDAQAQRLVLELVWAATDGLASPGEVCSRLAAVKDAGLLARVAELLPQTLWLVGLEVRAAESEEDKMMSPAWQKLCATVNALLKAKLVERAALLEQLEFDLISGCGWDDATTLARLNKVLVKTNTHALYVQRKFNLLAEESEGFAKLLNELESLHAGNLAAVTQNMQRLIGHFRLDPNRVFDIALDVFESDPANQDAFRALLSRFRGSKLRQILGFKFQMYHPEPEPSEGAEGAAPPAKPGEPTPMSLLYLTAQLCLPPSSSGGKALLSVEDVLGHLHPPQDDLLKMAAASERALVDAGKRVGIVRLQQRSAEQVARDAALESRKATLAAQRLRADNDTHQRFGLVAGFLACGRWQEALQLADALGAREAALDHPQVLCVLFQQLHAALAPLYEAATAVGALAASLSARSSSTEAARKGTAAALVAALGAQGSVQPLRADQAGCGDFAPLASLDALFSGAVPDVLATTGHRLAHAPGLLHMVCRLARAAADAAEADSDGAAARKRKAAVLRLLGRAVLPGLSALPTPNPALAADAWAALERFGFATRFDLYEQWRTEAYDRSAALKLVRVQQRHEAKQVLKRVANSKEAMRTVTRSLGKASHNNPLVVLSALLDNVQAYDNLAPSMVDALKYMTPLGFDAMAFLLVAYLGKDEASKIKADGQSHSNWLQALSKFAAHFFARYPSAELAGLMQYLVRQLKLRRGLDLLVLQSLLARMAGLELVEDFSEDVLAAMGGGDALRTQARASVASGSAADAVAAVLAVPGGAAAARERATQSLRAALEAPGLVVPLLVLMAQQQDAALFATDDKNLKLIGHKHDTAVAALMQFVEFLTTHVPLQELADKHMLPLRELCDTFHVQPVAAFHMARPLIAAALQQQQQQSEPASDSAAPAAAALDHDTAARWRPDAPELLGMAEAQIAAQGRWQALDPALYALFWSLSLYHLTVPRAQYDAEAERAKQRAAELRKAVANGAAPGGDALTSSASKKLRAEADRLDAVVSALDTDLRAQMQARTAALARFDAAKETWFMSAASPKRPALRAIQELLQLCVLPRVLFSPEDALYAARFIKTLHDRGAPGCSTVFVYDKALQYVSANLFCVTEREANNLGTFLRALLEHVAAWTRDKKTYQSQFEAMPGAFRSVGDPDSAKVGFEDFGKLVAVWHARLGSVAASALRSPSYMQIRPALLVATRLIDFVPASADAATEVRAAAQALVDEDERQDIKTLAQRYAAMLASKFAPPADAAASSKTPPPPPQPDRAASAAGRGAKRKSTEPESVSRKRGRDDDAAASAEPSRKQARAEPQQQQQQQQQDTGSRGRRNDGGDRARSSSRDRSRGRLPETRPLGGVTERLRPPEAKPRAVGSSLGRPPSQQSSQQQGGRQQQQQQSTTRTPARQDDGPRRSESQQRSGSGQRGNSNSASGTRQDNNNSGGGGTNQRGNFNNASSGGARQDGGGGGRGRRRTQTNNSSNNNNRR